MIINLINLINLLYRVFARILFKNKYTSKNPVIFTFGSGILSHSKDQVTLGKGVKLAGWLMIEGKGKISLGDYVTLNERSVIKSLDRVIVGSYVLISADVYVQDNNSHSIYAMDRRKEILEDPFVGGKGNTHLHTPDKAPIIIEDDVWIGRGSTILKGVTIGKGAVVAANSVVTKDVPSYTVAAGNPAKVVKNIKEKR